MKVNHWTVMSIESECDEPELRDVRVFSGRAAERKATDMFKRWVANYEGINLKTMDMADESTIDEAVLSGEYSGLSDHRQVKVYLMNTSVTVRA